MQNKREKSTHFSFSVVEVLNRPKECQPANLSKRRIIEKRFVNAVFMSVQRWQRRQSPGNPSGNKLSLKFDPLACGVYYKALNALR